MKGGTVPRLLYCFDILTPARRHKHTHTLEHTHGLSHAHTFSHTLLHSDTRAHTPHIHACSSTHTEHTQIDNTHNLNEIS
jgi:hypothetical protein